MIQGDRARLIKAIINDLEREIVYADKRSPLYGAVFREFRNLFGEFESAPRLCSDILDLWAEKTPHAWFERPLLLAAALHRVALFDPGCTLRRFYASCGGAFAPDVDGPALREAIHAVVGQRDGLFMRFLSVQSLQTNEVSRGLTWLLPATALWRRSPKPVALIEIGCSAGLNLIADRYGWLVRSDGWAQDLPNLPKINIQLKGQDVRWFADTCDSLPAFGRAVVQRVGVDLKVPDLTDPDARAMLEAMIWGEDADRLDRFRQAADLQASARAEGLLDLREGSAADVIPAIADALGKDLPERSLIIFFNTVVTCYFDDTSYLALKRAIAVAAVGPLRDHDVAWIEHEPRRPGAPVGGEPQAESSITLHRPDGRDGLNTDVIGTTEMHPKTLDFSWHDS